MSVDFSPPSYRAASSDLTISISPLGLVELADEEFEVHGPRLNRYSLNWAMYLGHHWGYRRDAGETQLTMNYYRAFSDYISNFTFGKGVQFRSPKETESIVPSQLKRIWEVDNDKSAVLFEMAQQGGVSGDCFVKVAWDPPYSDPVGGQHPGKVRILPLNASFCFPEFHPHDRSRLIRFKLKYRFWGTSLEGTRQVYTYTEILTDDVIQEYINDELIDMRPNPLGMIPVVHIPNHSVSGSPWGLADCHDIISLNRTYNEVATDISDIINYYAAPVTVIVGAKASNLERGPNKVWALPKDSTIENLEGGGSGLEGAMAMLDRLKTAMHEIMGVPETALGQVQPISNTSGVALSIQFQPLMNHYARKTSNYGIGLERINEVALRTLALYEPEAFVWNPDLCPPLKDGQLEVLDLSDPITYRSIAHFPYPLPLDQLIALNEIQVKLSLGLESREGALRTLGEEEPEAKLVEIRDELREDALADGSLSMLRAQINKVITELTGMVIGPDGSATPAMLPQDVPLDGGGPDGGAPQAVGPAASVDPTMPGIMQAELVSEADIRNTLVTQAFGTKLPQRRNPDDEANG